MYYYIKYHECILQRDAKGKRRKGEERMQETENVMIYVIYMFYIWRGPRFVLSYICNIHVLHLCTYLQRFRIN
jgi:hypothetical protein